MTPDINVLVAASRTDHTHHKKAVAWFTKALAAGEAGESLQILPMVAVGFVRLVTHPRIFINPTPIGLAIEYIHSLLVIPGVEMPELGREWPTLAQLCREKKLFANDISDAWIASAVRQNGDRLVTFDRGFKRLLSSRELTIL